VINNEKEKWLKWRFYKCSKRD